MSSNKPIEGSVEGSGAEQRKGFSRRTFIEGIGLGAGAVGSVVVTDGAQADHHVPVGPDPVSITLNINGKNHDLKVEPRVTLIDALRNQLDYTGAKKVCDRATCGACTVMLDGLPAYACTTFAIEAQGRKIETIEGISAGDKMHPVQQYFVEHDAQQCGFCTPGFVIGQAARRLSIRIRGRRCPKSKTGCAATFAVAAPMSAYVRPFTTRPERGVHNGDEIRLAGSRRPQPDRQTARPRGRPGKSPRRRQVFLRPQPERHVVRASGDITGPARPHHRHRYQPGRKGQGVQGARQHPQPGR